ncbi:MAG: hypothetical protein ACK58J_10390, partial [Planctomyces sp.]
MKELAKESATPRGSFAQNWNWLPSLWNGALRCSKAGYCSAEWVAFFCTDPNVSPEMIIESVADRSAIEQNFHDVK